MNWHRSVLLLLALWQTSLVAGELAKRPATERLVYEVSYQGALTANSKTPIASLALQTREVSLPSIAGPLFETSMRVSSGIFPFAEEHFPFRVRYRSLYQVNPFALRALEKYKLTDELKHEITWVDNKRKRVGRFRQQAGGRGLPATLTDWFGVEGSFGYYKPARHKIPRGLVDRLSMLESLKLVQMKPGAKYKFPVTDGKRLLDYRVEVLGLAQIQYAGKTRQAWKLVLNAFYTKKGVTSPRHAPIYLWMSKAQPRLPLRFLHHHPLGTFTVELQDNP